MSRRTAHRNPTNTFLMNYMDTLFIFFILEDGVRFTGSKYTFQAPKNNLPQEPVA